MKTKPTHSPQRRPGGKGLPRDRSESRPEALQAKVSKDFRDRLDRLVKRQLITRSQWLYEAARAQLERDELPPAPRDADGTMRLGHTSSTSMDLVLHRATGTPRSAAPLAQLRLSEAGTGKVLELAMGPEHLRRTAASLELVARELEAFDARAALAEADQEGSP